MPGEKCDDCGGARHVPGPNGTWKPCGCLDRARRLRALRAAGAPLRHDAETWGSFSSRYLVRSSVPRALSLLAGRLKCDGAHEECLELVLRGDDDGRELAASLLLRCAVEGGASAKILDVPSLIDRAFARDEAEGPDPAAVRFAVLRVGGEPRHSHNKTALERFLRARRDASLSTVLLGDHPARTAADLQAYDAEEAIRSRFAEAVVSRKA